MQLVALDDGLGAAGELRAAVAVDPGFIGFDAEVFDGTPHGEKRSLENVQSIDFLDCREGNGPCARIEVNLMFKKFPSAFAEQLRVPQSRNRPLRVEDHGGGIDRAGQGTPARFVDAADDHPDRSITRSSASAAFSAVFCRSRWWMSWKRASWRFCAAVSRNSASSAAASAPGVASPCSSSGTMRSPARILGMPT